jgi:hypothetical protein
MERIAIMGMGKERLQQLLAETEALTEARGGVVEAWREHLQNTLREFSYTLTNQTFSVRHHGTTFVADGNITLDLTNIPLNSRGDFAMPVRYDDIVSVQRRKKTPLTPLQKNMLSGELALILEIEVYLFLIKKGFVLRRGDVYRGWEADKMSLCVNLQLELSSNTYPPVREESLRESSPPALVEAKGGVVSAWKDYLHRQFQKFSLESRFYPINNIEGRGTLTYTGKIDVQDTTLTIYLKWRGDIYNAHKNTQILEKNIKMSYLRMVVSLSHGNFDLTTARKFEEWFQRIQGNVSSTGPEVVFSLSDDGEGIEISFTMNLSAVVEKNQYPPSVSQQESFSHLLSEARGGIEEAWRGFIVESLRKFSYPIADVYLKLSQRFTATGAIIMNLEKIEVRHGNLFYIPLEFVGKIGAEQKTNPADDQKICIIGAEMRMIEEKAYRLLIDSGVNKLRVGLLRGEVYYDYTNFHYFLVVDLHVSLGSQIYPPAQQEALSLPLQEARGGVAEAWVAFAKESFRGFSYDITLHVPKHRGKVNASNSPEMTATGTFTPLLDKIYLTDRKEIIIHLQFTGSIDPPQTQGNPYPLILDRMFRQGGEITKFWKALDALPLYTATSQPAHGGITALPYIGDVLFVELDIRTEIAYNKYPPTVNEDLNITDSPLTEAKGGVAEAWAQRLGQIFHNFTAPVTLPTAGIGYYGEGTLTTVDDARFVLSPLRKTPQITIAFRWDGILKFNDTPFPSSSNRGKKVVKEYLRQVANIHPPIKEVMDALYTVKGWSTVNFHYYLVGDDALSIGITVNIEDAVEKNIYPS